MQYLFFDIECASCDGGGKLCEFGYVLTDENFRSIRRENFVINPKSKFDYYVINKILNLPKSVYSAAPDLKYFYPRIYALLTAQDTLIVGHTTQGDAEHIGDDCLRYGLRSPDFDYVDIVDIYKAVRKESTATALTKMVDALGIESSEKAHSADVDAMLTKEVARSLCLSEGVSLSTLVSLHPESVGRIENYAQLLKSKRVLKEFTERAIERGKYASGDEKRVYNEYRRMVKLNETGRFFGKTVSFSDNFVNFACREAIALVAALANAGIEVVQSAAECDIFLRYDLYYEDTVVFCRKRPIAEKKAKRGKVEILSYDELCERIGAKELDLDAAYKKALREIRAFQRAKAKEKKEED